MHIGSVTSSAAFNNVRSVKTGNTFINTFYRFVYWWPEHKVIVYDTALSPFSTAKIESSKWRPRVLHKHSIPATEITHGFTALANRYIQYIRSSSTQYALSSSTVHFCHAFVNEADFRSKKLKVSWDVLSLCCELEYTEKKRANIFHIGSSNETEMLIVVCGPQSIGVHRLQ